MRAVAAGHDRENAFFKPDPRIVIDVDQMVRHQRHFAPFAFAVLGRRTDGPVRFLPGQPGHVLDIAAAFKGLAQVKHDSLPLAANDIVD